MIAIEITTPGEPDVLRPVERPDPTPGAGEVLIKVEAAGVNRPDILQRLGHYPPPPGASDIPGLEVGGTIAEAGAGVADWSTGDRVCALVAGGGYAEYCVAPALRQLPRRLVSKMRSRSSRMAKPLRSMMRSSASKAAPMLSDELELSLIHI